MICGAELAAECGVFSFGRAILGLWPAGCDRADGLVYAA